jgi:H+-translocating NAD(P) transhydrogenase subunit alpha
MTELLIMMSVLALSFIVGYLFISRVPPLLHTPLMSMTNAISAVTILGGLMLFSMETTAAEKAAGVVALAMAAFNLVGGFVITARMAAMFRKNPKQKTESGGSAR